MDFEYSPKAKEYVQKVRDFMEHEILPRNQEFHDCLVQGVFPTDVIEPLKAKAFEQGLWNMFTPELSKNEPGTRLTNMEYAPVAEVMGRVPWSPEVFNCSAPDTGNMEVLKRFGTDEQKAKWLTPLLHGEIRSIVGLTEPDVASSDLTNLETTIIRDGNEMVINGRKWFSTGGTHPNLKICILFGVSNPDPDAERHARHSFIIVPMDASGVEVVRDVPVMHHHSYDGHAEIRFANVRVPAENLIGGEGEGFKLAQQRLGPGRIHHCMRSIGQAELALELMCDRALARSTFGKRLSDNANIQDWIAESRIALDHARLMVLRTAWRMDNEGAQAARIDVSQIKVTCARALTDIADRAMQVFGAAGLTPDTPLAGLWTIGRSFRFADGPDEVHLKLIAREELRRAKAETGRNAQHFIAPGG